MTTENRETTDRRRGGRLLRWSLPLAVGGAILTALLMQTSWRQLGAVMSRGRPGWIAACFALAPATTLLRAVRFRPFSTAPHRLRAIYGVLAVSRGVNFVLPFRTGELVMLSLLKRKGLASTIAATLPVWALLRVADMAAVGLLALAAVLLAVDRGLLGTAAISLLAVAAGGAAVLAGAAWWWRLSAAVGRESWMGGRLAAMQQGLAELRHTGRTARTLLLSVAAWSLMAVTATAVQRAFDSPLPLSQCIVVSVSMLAIGVLPIHGPLGLGTSDASWTGLMAVAGVPLDEAVALALCYRLVLDANILLDYLLGTALLTRR